MSLTLWNRALETYFARPERLAGDFVAEQKQAQNDGGVTMQHDFFAGWIGGEISK